MNKECQPIQSLLERYLDQELAEKESAVIQDHLRRCPDCRKQFSIYQKTRAFFQASIHRSIDTFSFERLWPRIEKTVQSASGRRPEPSVIGRIFSRRYPAPVMVSVAAAVLLVLLIGVVIPFTRFLTRTSEPVSMAGKIQEQLGQDLQASGLLRFSMAEETKTFQVRLEGLKQEHGKLQTASPQAAAQLQERLGQTIRDHGHRLFQQSRTAAELQERLGTGIRDSARLRYLLASSQSTPNHRLE